MPNWVLTTLSIKGEKTNIDKFISQHISSVDTEFDFNTIEPMPKELETEPAIKNENILAVFHDIYLGLAPLNSSERDKLKLDAVCAAEAGRIKSLFDKYGAVSWYTWSRLNWGTKWNASDTWVGDISGSPEASKVVVTFNTAWTEPRIVIDKLVKLHPELKFNVEYTSEQ